MLRAFDSPIPHDGYRWWYIDVVSDDGQHGLTIIAMIGSVFSPYYAHARRRASTDPRDHCALNVALYQRHRGRWALTERGREDLHTGADHLRIATSSLRWEQDQLVVDIDERCAPWPRRLRGTLRLDGPFREDLCFALDPAGRHQWGPIAPATRAHLNLDMPDVRWSGSAYLDSNAGDEPLEKAFRRWHWSRHPAPDGSTEVHYDVDLRDGGQTLLALRIPNQGPALGLPASQREALPSTGWQVTRASRFGTTPTRVVRTLEDTPFYARSLLQTGPATLVMHESLDLDRFKQRWVQCLLPFRMPRVASGEWPARLLRGFGSR